MDEEALYLRLKYLQVRHGLLYGDSALLLNTLSFITGLAGLFFLFTWVSLKVTTPDAESLITYGLIITFLWVFFLAMRHLKALKKSEYQIFWHNLSWIRLGEVILWPLLCGVFALTPILISLNSSTAFSVLIMILAVFETTVSAILMAQIGIYVFRKGFTRVIYATLVALLIFYLQRQIMIFAHPVIVMGQGDSWVKILALLFPVSASIAILSLDYLVSNATKTTNELKASTNSLYSSARLFGEVYSYPFATFTLNCLKLIRSPQLHLNILFLSVIYIFLISRFVLPSNVLEIILVIVGSMMAQLISLFLGQFSRQSAKNLLNLPLSNRAWALGGFWSSLMILTVINGTVGFLTFSTEFNLTSTKIVSWLIITVLMHIICFNTGWNSQKSRQFNSVSYFSCVFLGLIALILF